MKLPADVKHILDKLYKNGFEGYVVGGCVRDCLMGKTPHDYDITTNALPSDIKKIFPHTVDTGIKHGTVSVIKNSRSYEITTYRIDGSYSDNRHPDEVIFTDKLSGDLSRRDFTINAIAYSPEKGYVDLFSGQEDIKKGIVRGVGDPEKRFTEDALRMMRAVRFAAQLNFEIEENTLSALYRCADLIKNISIERIREELFALILSDHSEKLEILIDSGMTKYFLPGLESGRIDYSVLGNLSKDIRLRSAFILRDFGWEKTNDIARSLKWDNKNIKDVTTIVRLEKMEINDPYSMRRLINLSGDTAPLVLELKSAAERTDKARYDSMYEAVKNDCTSLRDLQLDGNDLKKAGFDGKQIGEKLSEALDYVMRFPDRNRKDILLEYVKK